MAFESTTSRKAGGLDFTAIGGKRQGHVVAQSLKTTRWSRVRSPAVAGFGKPKQLVVIEANACPQT